MRGRHVQHHDHAHPEQTGRQRAVRQDRQRRDGAQQETEITRVGRGQRGRADGHQQQYGQHPHPPRWRRAPQPAAILPVPARRPAAHRSHIPKLRRRGGTPRGKAVDARPPVPLA
ncbi:hypothetical protein EASAB2608_07885 [Streptomyces sp. EAS-AB2608]|nr:hypothetical protein EASAB2608_07885 [Streptomyces sp. EAS-AB2608]